ncbi:MAG: hypothetical protein AABW99_02010 [archaeon]
MSCLEFRLTDNGRIDESTIVDYGSDYGTMRKGKRAENFFSGKENEAVQEMIKELETQIAFEERNKEREA